MDVLPVESPRYVFVPSCHCTDTSQYVTELFLSGCGGIGVRRLAQEGSGCQCRDSVSFC